MEGLSKNVGSTGAAVSVLRILIGRGGLPLARVLNKLSVLFVVMESI